MQPSLASLLNAPYRAKLIQNFVNKTKSEGTLDGQRFWQAREFYSPGTFKYNHDGFHQSEVAPILKEINTNVKDIKSTIPFLIYRSDKWVSAEFLVPAPNIIDSVAEVTTGKEIVLKTPTAWVYYENPTTLKIIFTKNIDDMQKSNGFFDYPGHDKEYLNDKYWLSISEVDL